MKVCMIITDGFEEIEAIGTFAILRRGSVDVDVYSLLDKDATGRFGITCTNLCLLYTSKGREYINNGYLKDSDDMLTKLMYPLPAYYAGYSDMLEYYIDLFKSTNKA